MLSFATPETGKPKSSIDPVASMEAIDNPALKQAAAQIRAKLERVIAQL